MLKGCRMLLLTIVGLCVLGISPWGKSGEYRREILAGLDSITVIAVIQKGEDLTAFTSLEHRIKIDIELKLRTLGIVALDFPGAHYAALCAHVQILPVPNGASAIKTMLELYESVRLTRNDSLAVAVTWEKNIFSYCPKSHSVDDYISGLYKEMIDEFLNDYLAVNPKNRK